MPTRWQTEVLTIVIVCDIREVAPWNSQIILFYLPYEIALKTGIKKEHEKLPFKG